MLHRTVGASVYSVDVADPSDPESLDDFRAYSGVCTEISGFLIFGETGYLACGDSVGAVALPNAAQPEWVWELPDGDDYRAIHMSDWMDEAFVVSRIRSSDGDLIFSDGTRVLLDFVPRSPVTSGEFLLARGSVAEEDALTVFNTSGGNVVEVGELSLGETFADRDFVARGRDLFGFATPELSETARSSAVTWHRFNEDFTDIELVASVVEPSWRSWSHSPVVVGEFLFVGSNGHHESEDADVAETVILHLSSAGMEVVRRIPAGHRSGFVGDIVVDPIRDLVFVGGGGVQILDLCAVTTGEPCWP